MASEYQALVSKVESFVQAAWERRKADMACREGCDGCCHAWLSLSPVEADAMREALRKLPPEARAEIAARGARELAREAAGESPARCAMLDGAGRCAVYEGRPLVCRTQGHALRYPSGVIPEAAIFGRAGGKGDVTYCPLNFTESAPEGRDVLDAELVDKLLSVVNLRFAAAAGIDPESRTSVSQIAQEADMLGCSQSEA